MVVKAENIIIYVANLVLNKKNLMTISIIRLSNTFIGIIAINKNTIM